MRHAVAAIVALALFAGQVLATPVAAPAGTVVRAPNWAAGSEWYYSDGYAMKVTSVTPQVTVFDRIDAPGQWFSRAGFIRKDSASSTATRNAVYRTISDTDGFALTAGSPLTFQREYMSNGVLMVHASSWTVEGRETITVPAGTFDCWLIVWRTRSLKSDWTGFERWWYSPVAQNYVRLEYKYGPGAEGSRVLMRYNINGPVAAPLAQTSAAASTPVGAASEMLPSLPKRAVLKPSTTVAVPPPVMTARAPGQAKLNPVSPPAEEAPKSRLAPPAYLPAASAPSAPEAEIVPARKLAETADLPASTGGSWHAQIGSSKDQAAMRVSLKKTLDGNPQFAKLPHGIASHAVPGRGTFYRAWVGEFDKQSDAKAVCGAIIGKGPGCSAFKALARETRSD